MDRFCYRIYQHATATDQVAAGDKIIVSLSGGVDSMCLFRVLETFREKIALDLHLVHFNHGLRVESADEEAFVQALARKRDCPVTVIRATGLKKGKGLQNQARIWRYRELNRIMTEIGFDRIALGHQLNDLIETQLWRMLRGGSLFSFEPMADHQPPYIRPLLKVPKDELQRYLAEIRQPWCEDSSNRSDDYTRNLIRNRLIPLLVECSGGGRFEEKMLALSRDAQRLKSLFEAEVRREHYQTQTIAYRTIVEMPELFGLETIHRFLCHHGQDDIKRAHIQRIYDLVAAGRGGWRLNLKNRVDVVGCHGKIRLVES
jgi:tRNA(Ile)-lysidine synthase